jgi:uncharacterized membrane protein|tara:strand:+ start:1323 stop:1544 length:222 start_codon:yes stop_codon:yes gene_type:complete
MIKKLLFLLIFFSINPNIAYAYLDPGTGSIILQALVSIIAAIAAFFSLARYKVREFFKSLFKKKTDDADKDNK